MKTIMMAVLAMLILSGSVSAQTYRLYIDTDASYTETGEIVNKNVRSIPPVYEGEYIGFRLFAPFMAGRSIVGYTIALGLESKESESYDFETYVSEVSGTDFNMGEMIYRVRYGTPLVYMLYRSPDASVVVPPNGYLGTVLIKLSKTLSKGDRLFAIRGRSFISERNRSTLVYTRDAYIKFGVCKGDFNEDGQVNVPDFLMFVDAYGLREGDDGYNAVMDLDKDGTVGVSDFLIFVDLYGTTCE